MTWQKEWQKQWDEMNKDNPFGKFHFLEDMKNADTLLNMMNDIKVNIMNEMAQWLVDTHKSIIECRLNTETTELPNCFAFWNAPITQGPDMDFRAPNSFVKKYIEGEMKRCSHLHPLIKGNILTYKSRLKVYATSLSCSTGGRTNGGPFDTLWGTEGLVLRFLVIKLVSTPSIN